MKRGLLIIFQSVEQAPDIRGFLTSLNGKEISTGVWFLPNGATPRLFLDTILARLNQQLKNESIAVFRVGLDESQAGIHRWNDLLELFRREHGQGL
jgi:hypothetical protein